MATITNLKAMQNRQNPHPGAASDAQADGAQVRASVLGSGHVESVSAVDYEQFTELLPSSNNRYLQVGRGQGGGKMTKLRLGSMIVLNTWQHNRTICEAAGLPGWHYAIVPLRWRGELRYNGATNPESVAAGLRPRHHLRAHGFRS